MQKVFFFILLLLVCFYSLYPIGDEIQVYADDMLEPGEYGVEVHSNYVADGPTRSSYSGELPSNKVLQVTPEFAYGITKNLELGMYFPPMALTPNGKLYENGIRFRLKFISDPIHGSQFFWGLNTELGYSAKRVSESNWNLELRPILGYKTNSWLFSFNPNLDIALSGKENTPEFDPCFKVGYIVQTGIMLGLEDYAGFGSINKMSNLKKSENIGFLAMDITKGKVDINFGLGYGISNTNEKAVVKMIFAIPF